MGYAAKVDDLSLFRISMAPGMKISELSISRPPFGRRRIFDFGCQTGRRIDFHVSFDYDLCYLRL